MTKAAIDKNLEKSAREMRDLVVRSKRKLLEFEALASLSEIKRGKSEVFTSAKDLLQSLK